MRYIRSARRTVELERGRGPVEYAKEWEDLGYPEYAIAEVGVVILDNSHTYRI